MPKVVLEKKLPCYSGQCNNGCPAVYLAQQCSGQLGGKPRETMCTPTKRIVVIDGLTPIDPNATIVGEGVTEISGEVAEKPGKGYMCHFKIIVTGDSDYSPDLRPFKNLTEFRQTNI